MRQKLERTSYPRGLVASPKTTGTRQESAVLPLEQIDPEQFNQMGSQGGKYGNVQPRGH